MRDRLSMGEKLTDLRVAKGLTQEELADELGISRTAISNYENIDNCNKKAIDHLTLVALAEYYGVSTDFLVGLDDNSKMKATPISELHLSDEAITEIKSQKFNNRILSELITHPEFQRFIDDIEIYINGYVEYRFNKLNAEVQVLRLNIEQSRREHEDVPQTDRDIYEKAAAEGLIDETDYFSYKTHEVLKRILKDLRDAHKLEGENMITTKADLYRDLSDEELAEKLATFEAIKQGKDPKEFISNITKTSEEPPADLDMQVILNDMGISTDALSREEFDFLYKILLKSNKVYKFSKRHKKSKREKNDSNKPSSD